MDIDDQWEEEEEEAAGWGVGSADVEGEGDEEEEEWRAEGTASFQWPVEGDEVEQEEEGGESIAPWRQPRQQQEDAEVYEAWDGGGGSAQQLAGQKRKRTRKNKATYSQW